jgi:acetate kinase
MNDYAVVLNAGSSSLKFCVYQRPTNEAWQLEARGQVEGIGTSPRFSARNGVGERLADEALTTTRSCATAAVALDAAGWLRSTYGALRCSASATAWSTADLVSAAPPS